MTWTAILACGTAPETATSSTAPATPNRWTDPARTRDISHLLSAARGRKPDKGQSKSDRNNQPSAGSPDRSQR